MKTKILMQISENSKITSMIDEYNLLTPEQKQNYLNIKKTTEKNQKIKNMMKIQINAIIIMLLTKNKKKKIKF